MQYPKKLQKGDTVGLICTSSPVNEERAKECIATVEALGYKVKIADNLTENYGGYMAGSGMVRGQWVNKMFADQEIRAIFCVRGGDAGSRAVEYLDKEIIRNNPKIFVGYSDVTSFHLFFNQECGLITFHGPMVSSNMVYDFDKETQKSLMTAINAHDDFEYIAPTGMSPKVLIEGRATGVLTGGNLALLSAAMGTEYEADTKGKILFIEEAGETMPRIERYIYQLRNSGKLAAAAGILLGQFTDCQNPRMPEYREIDCFRDALSGLNIPVMYNIQSGHGKPMMTLPFGILCTVDTFKRSIKFHI